jgi:rhamnose utilization protein RhaD (predicted bifunctional aldolase and dehydrogenase)/NAD(P)-dependent dehydrogenase (short-subunit alcohol dehydrogenase family)
MQNRWNQKQADSEAANDLELRVYTSRLLGQDPDLVLHGGGNTSIKGVCDDVFGEARSTLFVKGSGWDLRTIEAAGFPAVDLDYLIRLADLPSLSDSEMMRQLRMALFDPTAPTPSVEAILHALIPFKVVDHSHADAVVAISNTANGEAALKEIYGERVLILPYIMPGFILAQQVAEAARDCDWQSLDGIVLMHHGIFTFAEDAKDSYEAMISLVAKAEDYLSSQGALESQASVEYQPQMADFLALAKLRSKAAAVLGKPALLRWDHGPLAAGFAALENVEDIATRGPLTPDHTIHAKSFAAIFSADLEQGLDEFTARYQQYFDDHASDQHQCLDPMPRYGVWRGKGMLYLAANLKRLRIVSDISDHTIKAIQWGEALGGWQALPQQDLFDIEYWELEQAKLKSGGSSPRFEGKVALITGSASGIGKACVKEFLARGAVVAALDIADQTGGEFADNPAVLTIKTDVTDRAAIDQAIQKTVAQFGGIDLIVSNAGNFPGSVTISDMDDETWNSSMALNLDSHRKLLGACTPFLAHGLDPAVVIIGSKNVQAPGPGAAAYSVGKAGLAQLARIAALELGSAGIRVNVLHPNAVFDTSIWTDEVIAQRAQQYGMSVDQYKRNNVLQNEITSQDVAMMAAVFAGQESRAVTGAQIPVDGGNDRVI